MEFCSLDEKLYIFKSLHRSLKKKMAPYALRDRPNRGLGLILERSYLSVIGITPESFRTQDVDSFVTVPMQSPHFD